MPSDSSPPQPPATPQDSPIFGPEHIARILRLTIGAVSFGLLIWLLGDVMMVIFASVLCAVVLYGLSNILRRHLGLSHGWALSIVVLALLSSAGLLVWNSGPSIVSEAIRLQEALRQQEAALRDNLQGSPTGQMILSYLPASLGGHHTGGDSSLASLGSRIAGSMTGILGSAFGAIGTLVVILIAGLYFAMSPATYANGLLRLVPEERRPIIDRKSVV